MSDGRVRLKQDVYYTQKLVFKLVNRYCMPMPKVTVNFNQYRVVCSTARDCSKIVLKLHGPNIYTGPLAGDFFWGTSTVFPLVVSSI
jgi:hypothetical protein